MVFQQGRDVLDPFGRAKETGLGVRICVCGSKNCFLP